MEASGSDSLSTLLSRLDPQHASALEWFADNQGQSGSRPLGLRVEGTAITAYRGIHVPSGWQYALSVYQSQGSPYDDLPPAKQSDGTWLFLYKAHRGSDGVGLDSRWNRGLYNCLLDRVPVGVFRPAPQSKSHAYEVLGLAFVEEYLAETDTFVLRGPLRQGQPHELWETLDPVAEGSLVLPRSTVQEAFRPYETTDERKRVTAEVVRRERQDQFRDVLLNVYGHRCVISGYDATAALEAAHIVPYRGRGSHAPENGLLLRSDLHRLFDRHLVTVETDSLKVRLAPQLDGTRYRKLAGKTIESPRIEGAGPNREAVQLHNRLFHELWG
jgi:hypothetical protein